MPPYFLFVPNVVKFDFFLSLGYFFLHYSFFFLYPRCFFPLVLSDFSFPMLSSDSWWSSLPADLWIEQLKAGGSFLCLDKTCQQGLPRRVTQVNPRDCHMCLLLALFSGLVNIPREDSFSLCLGAYRPGYQHCDSQTGHVCKLPLTSSRVIIVPRSHASFSCPPPGGHQRAVCFTNRLPATLLLCPLSPPLPEVPGAQISETLMDSIG